MRDGTGDVFRSEAQWEQREAKQLAYAQRAAVEQDEERHLASALSDRAQPRALFTFPSSLLGMESHGGKSEGGKADQAEACTWSRAVRCCGPKLGCEYHLMSLSAHCTR